MKLFIAHDNTNSPQAARVRTHLAALGYEFVGPDPYHPAKSARTASEWAQAVIEALTEADCMIALPAGEGAVDGLVGVAVGLGVEVVVWNEKTHPKAHPCPVFWLDHVWRATGAFGLDTLDQLGDLIAFIGLKAMDKPTSRDWHDVGSLVIGRSFHLAARLEELRQELDEAQKTFAEVMAMGPVEPATIATEAMQALIDMMRVATGDEKLDAAGAVQAAVPMFRDMRAMILQTESDRDSYADQVEDLQNQLASLEQGADGMIRDYQGARDRAHTEASTAAMKLLAALDQYGERIKESPYLIPATQAIAACRSLTVGHLADQLLEVHRATVAAAEVPSYRQPAPADDEPQAPPAEFQPRTGPIDWMSLAGEAQEGAS